MSKSSTVRLGLGGVRRRGWLCRPRSPCPVCSLLLVGRSAPTRPASLFGFPSSATPAGGLQGGSVCRSLYARCRSFFVAVRKRTAFFCRSSPPPLRAPPHRVPRLPGLLRLVARKGVRYAPPVPGSLRSWFATLTLACFSLSPPSGSPRGALSPPHGGFAGSGSLCPSGGSRSLRSLGRVRSTPPSESLSLTLYTLFHALCYFDELADQLTHISLLQLHCCDSASLSLYQANKYVCTV